MLLWPSRTVDGLSTVLCNAMCKHACPDLPYLQQGAVHLLLETVSDQRTVLVGSPGPWSMSNIMQVGLYSIAFGFSWGPIGWLLPSEIHDLNTRSAGQSITVFTQLMSGAVVTQSKFTASYAGTSSFGSDHELHPTKSNNVYSATSLLL